jgi:hypothetical protein
MTNNNNTVRTEIMEGLAMYAQVQKPSTANNENKFIMDLLLDKGGTAKAKSLGFKVKKKKPREIDAELMDQEDIEKAERYNTNILAFSEFKDQGFGGEYITVKLQAEKGGVARSLTIIDAQKNPLPKTVLIGNGSKVKVKFILQNKETLEAQGRPVPDYMKNHGAQAYFIPGDSPTLQVINLVEYGDGEGSSGGGDGFDTVEGGYETPVGQTSKAPVTDDFESDDIPF